MVDQGKSDMETFLSLAKTLVTDADKADRKKVLDTLRGVAYSLESPEDTIQRILNLRLASVRVGTDLKLFDLLSKNGAPMTVEQLAAITGASPLLLGRLLRYLASLAMIKETAKDSFAATNITQALSVPGFQAGVHHYFDSFGPAFQALPDFLKDTKRPGTPPNPLSNETPRTFAHFNQWMVAQRHGMPGRLSSGRADSPEEPFFVDVGGGPGHQCIALRERFPHLNGKVDMMAQDFFEPQVVRGTPVFKFLEIWTPNHENRKGSKIQIYYMRNILHDYPDKQCLMILKNTMAAMDKDSKILIDDMVLSTSGVHWQAAQLDLAMMTALAAVERTREQWYTLLEGAGLKVRIWMYTNSLQDSIIEAVLA